MLAEMEPGDIAAAGRIGEEQAEEIKALAAAIPPLQSEDEPVAAAADQVAEGVDAQIQMVESEPVDAIAGVAGSAAEDDEQLNDSAQKESEREENLPTTGNGNPES